MSKLRFSPLRAVITLFLAAVPVAAQSSAVDSTSIARLTALGRLWGVVKYFHPGLAGRDIGWDSATAVAIERVQRAQSTQVYSDAVRALLATLGDPATRLAASSSAKASEPAAFATRWEIQGSDSVYIVTIPAFDDFARVITALRAATNDILRAPAVVFDLRGPAPEETGAASYVFANAGINRLLPATSVRAPAQRLRMHSGFPPQTGGTSGGYWSGTYERDSDVFAPMANARNRRIVFLVTAASDVPTIAFALRSNGQGAIVQEGEGGALVAAVDQYKVAMGEGIEALVRLGDYSGVSTVDTLLTAPSSPDAALRAALDFARRPVTVREQRAPATASAPGAARPLPRESYPAASYRILAAYQWWNAIYYFYPYKQLIGENWSAVLPQSIARMEAARDSLDYALGVAEMATRIHDSHGFVSGRALVAYFGAAPVGAQVQYIGGEPVVVSIAEDSATKASGIEIGDVILQVDGEKTAARKERFGKYMAHSTPQALDAQVAQRLLFGPEGSARLTVRDRNNRVRELTLPRRTALQPLVQYPRSGPIMRILPGNIGYADLSRLTVAMVDSMFEQFRNTKGIILDDRGYPQGTAWAIAPRLTDKRSVPAAQFQRPLVISPDSSQWTTYGFVQYIPTPTKWRYTGKTVVLVDERTISQAEHTVMFFEAANHSTIIGSPTMGANGDVTNVTLAGGVTVFFTGHDVRHADGRQLQRVGIKPDILVRPTLAGIRAGRDEVLARAIEFLNAPKPAAAKSNVAISRN